MKHAGHMGSVRHSACPQVYILGVSHVSRESCQEIQELIQAVRPDVVLLELCKDRLRLLLDQVRSPLPPFPSPPSTALLPPYAACWLCLLHSKKLHRVF